MITPVEADIEESYPTPLRESADIVGLLASYDTCVELSIDGIAQPRPAR